MEFGGDVSKPFVIIVEDNVDDQTFMKLALERCGVACSTLIFDSAEEVIAYIERKGKYKGQLYRECPSFIMLDINLGGLTGFDVLRVIRLDPVLRMVPVVMQSSSDNDDDICRAYQLGANSYLQKPTSIEEMARQIGLAIGYWLTCNRIACCEALPRG